MVLAGIIYILPVERRGAIWYSEGEVTDWKGVCQLAKVSILGTGGFGVSLAATCYKYGHQVTLWGLFPDEVNAIIRDGEQMCIRDRNSAYLYFTQEVQFRPRLWVEPIV